MKKTLQTIGSLRRYSVAIALIIGIGYWDGNYPSFAADPFRSENSRDIGEHTEAAFKTIFLQGDYQKVKQELTIAETEETNEPLVYAMQASLAYTEEDWESLKKYALQTLEKAQGLQNLDSVRGNLYLAVGHFLDGAYIYEKEGPVGAINKLQLVFKFLDAAEASDPNDPELNLIKGYMDLLLAVNLPFSSPEQAIDRFQKYAAPDYLVERGLAVAYRDLKKYDRALEFVDRALKIAPENPELYYLKGQILRKIGKNSENIGILEDALAHFQQALSKSAQLPKFITKPLEREMRQTQEKIGEIRAEASAKSQK
jgi:tetratricopeptide (TPR) repeat protein